MARLSSARAKEILALLASVPAVASVLALVPAVHSGQAIDLKPLAWDGPLALVLGLIVALVNMAAFGEFFATAQAMPGLVMPEGLVLWAPALTSLLAVVLMLTQRNLKRLLAFSTVEDFGFLLLGLASATAPGMEGALLAACTHALATRSPASAFAFLFGMLAMLGVPPLMGFLGRRRLYEAAYGLDLRC